MSFAKNLQYLRKKISMTQDDLSEALGVSRQSVSKWETGEAYPETDKLIALCDMFSVTLDELLRGDVTAEAHPAPEEEKPCVGAAEYATHMNCFARNIALGVFIILIGVSLCVAFGGLNDFYGKESFSVFSVLCATSILIAVAVAVFIFVFSGMRHEEFLRKNPEIKDNFTEDEKSAFNKRFSVWMAVLVSSVLLDVVALVVFTTLTDALKVPLESNALYMCVTVAVFLFILAFIVGGLVYFGIQKSKYDMTEIKKAPVSHGKKLADTICGVIMLTATAIFLFIGFVFGIWHPSWVVFPIGGIACGIISIIFERKDK